MTATQGFSKRIATSTPIEMVDPWIINRSIDGINRRIARERSHIHRCEDLEVVLCKLATIEKLKAIKKQLRVFKIALVYSSYKRNVFQSKFKNI